MPKTFTTGILMRGRASALRRVKVCALAATVALACGCRSQSPAPVADVTLRIGAGGSEAAEAKGVLTDFLYAESLISHDWQGKPVERLASSWNWEDNGLALRIQIRPGVTMHDGRPLTAQFAADVIRRAATRDRGFEYLSSIETPTNGVLILRLSRPDTFLLDAIAATMIVDGDVGTGPFKLVSRVPTIEGERHDGYYRGTPGLKHVSIVPYDRQRTAWAAMMRGEVDMLQEVARESVEFLQGVSAVNTYRTIRPYYIPLVFNQRHPVLRQVQVRRALVEAIDREEIVRQAMRGRGMVASDPIWPFNWAYSAAARQHEHNSTTAAARLDAARLPVRPGRPGEMAKRLEIECIFWREGPQFDRIALLLQRQFAQVAIDLKLVPLTLPELMQRVRAGRFDTYLMYMTSGRTFQRTYQFWHSPPPEGAQYQDPGYSGVDAVLEELRAARTESEVRAAVADLRQRFYEDVPAAFLAWPETTRAVDARFDVGGKQTPDIFAEMWRWRPAGTLMAGRR